MSPLRLETALFLLAVGYLTVLPVGGRHRDLDDLRVRSVKFHPIVGAGVGVCAALTVVLASVVLPWAAAVILSLAVTLLLTGAFHEHGLADAADGLWAPGSREDALARMERPAITAHGVLAVGLVVGLKVSLLLALSSGEAAVALILGHTLGAMAAVHMRATCVAARSAGMQILAPGVTPDGYRTALVSVGALCVITVWGLGVWPVIAALCAAVLLAQAFLRLFQRRIGGYTGDGLGGAHQMGELGAYLGVSLMI